MNGEKKSASYSSISSMVTIQSNYTHQPTKANWLDIILLCMHVKQLSNYTREQNEYE